MNTANVETTRTPELARLVDDLTAKLQRGEQIDLAAIVNQHPEYADELRELLPALAALGDLSKSCSVSFPLTADGGALEGTLGDFRLIREVGRGGMGIVYEAEQISLARRVALKMLPFAATMDPRQLQRFKNEALAAASLEHPNIVPVHGVGCERGVHYYAMKFIEGQSLAQLIQSLHDPADHHPPASDETTANPAVNGSAPTAPFAGLSTKPSVRNKTHFRRIAELIAQSAEALEHAHSVGIVHRDVKPGNLLLDSAGKVYISDFGLARFGTDAGMTMSGDLIGTLRYMSPEQALARHGLVDHRTDIYSLGATLYELLTLQPAVGGDDKGEILKAVAWEEPTPLRKLGRSIPTELETITLKCLAKNPGERYATAGEMAADLRRWVEDKPIKAKPPGWREKALKWGRRHKHLVLSTAAVTLVAAMGLAGSTAVAWKKNGEIRTALDERIRERDRAQANLRVANDSVKRMLSKLATDRLAHVPQMQKVRAEVLQDALELNQRLVQAQSSNSGLRGETAMAHSAIGLIQYDLGHKPEAAAAHREAIVLWEQLAAEIPNEAAWRHALAGELHNLARALNQTAEKTEGGNAIRRAVLIQEQLVAEYPNNPEFRDYLANMQEGLGNLKRAIELKQGLVDQFPTNVNHRSHLNGLQTLAASQLLKAGQPDDAIRTFRQVLDSQERLVAENPTLESGRHELVSTLFDLGVVLTDLGRLSEAEEAFKKALPHVERLVRDFPATPEYRRDLGYLHYQWGVTLFGAGRFSEAVEQHRAGLTVRERLAAEWQADEEYRRNVADSQHEVGNNLMASDKSVEAEPYYRRALASFRELSAKHSSDRGLRRLVATAQGNLGSVLDNTGHPVEAEQNLTQAVTEMEKLSAEAPEDLECRRSLGVTLENLAGIQESAHRPRDAAISHRRALAVLEPIAKEAPSDPFCKSYLAGTRNHLAWLLVTSVDDAMRDPRQGLTLAELAVKAMPANGSYRNTLGVAQYRAGNWKDAIAELDKSIELSKGGDATDWFFLAMARWQLGDREHAGKNFAQAVEWMKKNKPQDEELRRFRAEAAVLLGIKIESAAAPPEKRP